MPSRVKKYKRKDTTEISCCLKYSIFSVNVICWVIFLFFCFRKIILLFFTNYSQLFGLSILSVGIWALNEKNALTNLSTTQIEKLFLDPATFFMFTGSITFLIGEKNLHKNLIFCYTFNLKYSIGFTGCVGSLRENTFLLSMVII